MLTRLISVCTTLCLVAWTVAPVAAQETLAWKFQAGESLKYVVTQTTDMQMDLAGQKQTVAMSQKMDMVWKVGNVAANGNAEMSQVVERVQMKSEGGPFGSVQFDSSDGQIPESPLVKSMVEVLKKIVGQEFGVTMRPTGRIEDVKVPESLLQELTKSGAAGNAIDEEVLKQMMTQSAVTLPDKAIRPGDSWDSTQKIEMRFGTMSVNSVLTYKGDDTAGMALINMKPTIAVQPKEGAPITLTVNGSEGQGTVKFDKANGRISSSELDLTLEMEIRQFGQQIKQTLRQKTLMELVR